MHAHSLAHAIELQNAVAYGLTAGLYTQNPDDLARVARQRAGGQPLRQPRHHRRDRAAPAVRRLEAFIGRRGHEGGRTELPRRPRIVARSRAAPRPPRRCICADSTPASAASSRRLSHRWTTTRSSGCAEARCRTPSRGTASSVRCATSRTFDVERNLFRYRPVDVAVRATGDASWQALLRVVVAGIRAGSDFTVSAPVGLPGAVRRSLSDQGVAVFVESEEQWLERMVARDEGSARAARARLVGSAESVDALHRALAEAVDGDPDLASTRTR